MVDESTADIPCTPIGVAHTPLRTTDQAPRQGQAATVPGRLELHPEVAAGLTGVDAGDELDVVWCAHRADRGVLVLDDGRGVFSTRSPARPNPICVTQCTVRDVDGTVVRVRGVDMLEGTPVLDLKRALRPT